MIDFEKKAKEIANAYQGLIEWIEEGFPPECSVVKGLERVKNVIAKDLVKPHTEGVQEERKRILEGLPKEKNWKDDPTAAPHYFLDGWNSCLDTVRKIVEGKS